MDGTAEILKHLVGVLAQYPGLSKNKYAGSFPKLRTLEKNKLTHIKIILEQAGKFLNPEWRGSKNYWCKDDAPLIDLLVGDIQLFCTKYQIDMQHGVFASYGRERLTSKTLYTVARSELFSASYKDVELLMAKVDYELFSIPFVIRLAIEEKVKGIVGFKSSDIKVGDGVIRGSSEFPIVQVLTGLKELDCMNVPIDFQEVKDIYAWSCRFCHTAKKEYVWMVLKALDKLYPLFDYDEQCKTQKPIEDVWGDTQQDEVSLIVKLSNYKRCLQPLYYLKDSWTLNKVMDALNEKLAPGGRRIYLDTTEFDEREGLYSAQHDRYF